MLKKILATFAVVWVSCTTAHAFQPAIAVTVKDGTLQPGTTAGFNVSSGTVQEFSTVNMKSTGTWTLTGVIINGTKTEKSTTTFQQGEFSGTRNDNSTTTWIGGGNTGTRNDSSTTTFLGGEFSGTRNDNSTTTLIGAVLNGTKVDNSSTTFTGSSTFTLVGITTANINNIGLTSISGMRNRIINGDMFFDQRYEGAQRAQNSGSSGYHLDLWSMGGEAADGVYYSLRTSTVSPPPPFVYALRITVGTVDSSIGSAQAYIIRQFIEGGLVRDLAWGTASAQPIVLSFWSKTSFSGTFGGSVYNNAGNRNYPFTYTNPSANVWTYQQIAIPGDTSGTWNTDNTIGVAVTFDLGTGSSFRSTANAWEGGIVFGVTGTASLISTAAATMDLTGVQFEIGTKATAFEFRPYDDELQHCQRYYEKSYDVGVSSAGSPTNSGQMFGVSTAIAAATAECQNTFFKVTKRTAPTILTYDVTAGASVSGKGRWYTTGGVGAQRTTTVDNAQRTNFAVTEGDNNTDAHCLYQWTADASQ